MVRVKKANAEYRVPEEKLEEYLALGYCQIDESGGVVRGANAQGITALKAEAEQLKAEVEQLTAENQGLRAEIAALKSAQSSMGEKPKK